MKPKVEWISVDLPKFGVDITKKSYLPSPLSHQSGGNFWVVTDSGIHGKRIHTCHWTGERFLHINNDIITHFAKIEYPDYPNES